jgi:hypothetical protein
MTSIPMTPPVPVLDELLIESHGQALIQAAMASMNDTAQPPVPSVCSTTAAGYDARPIESFRLDPDDDAGHALNPEGQHYVAQLCEQIHSTRKQMARQELELARATTRLQDLVGPFVQRFMVQTAAGVVLVEPDPNAGWARPHFTEQADLELG